MLLAQPTAVFLLARLLNFIHRTTISAGSDLKTILVLYDTPSTQITNDILCSSSLQSVNVTWSTINVDAQLRKNDFKHGHTLILAIIENSLHSKFDDGLQSLKINPFKDKTDIILIYPFEISDKFLAEFKQISYDLSIILVNFVNDNITVILRSIQFERTLFLTEFQFENDIENLFYRPLNNLQSKPFDVIVAPEPPLTFNTIRRQIYKDYGQRSEKMSGIAGADLYLTQLIADCLNGTAKFRAITVKNNEEMMGETAEYIDFVKNKVLLPLKAPALPTIENVEYLSEQELMR